MRVKIQPFFSMSIYYILVIMVILISLCFNLATLHNIVYTVLIFLFVLESFQFNEFLSSILINDSAIILELQTLFKTRHIVIPADDIKDFHVDVKAYTLGMNGRRVNYKSAIANFFLSVVDCKTIIKISTSTTNYIYNVKSNMSIRLCPYEAFLRLLDVSNFIPKFSKTIDTNDAFTYKDINYYSKYHRRLTFSERFRHS